MKNRLKINNNFATVRRRTIYCACAPRGHQPPSADRRDATSASSAASLLAAAPVTALAPTVSAAHPPRSPPQPA